MFVHYFLVLEEIVFTGNTVDSHVIMKEYERLDVRCFAQENGFYENSVIKYRIEKDGNVLKENESLMLWDVTRGDAGSYICILESTYYGMKLIRNATLLISIVCK